jgi:hypothetical protein
MVTPLSLFSLIDMMKKDGCPVCRQTYNDVESYLHSLFFEGYKFPENHDQFRAGRGLCNAHAWQAAESFKGALLNIATFYRGALHEVIQALDSPTVGGAARSGLSRLFGGETAPSSPLADKLEATGPCVACKIRATSEQLYTRTIGENATDQRLTKAYKDSDGLCLPHFRMALRYARGSAEQQALVTLQRGVWETLLADLDTFREMHDHRRTGEYMQVERDSWLRVLRGMAGEDRMFGVDDSAD